MTLYTRAIGFWKQVGSRKITLVVFSSLRIPNGFRRKVAVTSHSFVAADERRETFMGRSRMRDASYQKDPPTCTLLTDVFSQASVTDTLVNGPRQTQLRRLARFEGSSREHPITKCISIFVVTSLHGTYSHATSETLYTPLFFRYPQNTSDPPNRQASSGEAPILCFSLRASDCRTYELQDYIHTSQAGIYFYWQPLAAMHSPASTKRSMAPASHDRSPWA